MIMDINVELHSKEYGDHVVVVYFPTHKMLIDRTAIETEDGRALLTLAVEIQTLRTKVASAEVLVDALREIDSLSPIHSVDGWIKEVQLHDGETCGQIVNQFDNEVLIAKIATKALATYDKISEDNIMEKSLSLAKSQLNNYKKLSEVKHDTNNERERYIVRREFKDITLYAYAHYHGFFTWGIKDEAVKLDTKLEAEALIASMSLANDDSVSVEELEIL